MTAGVCLCLACLPWLLGLPVVLAPGPFSLCLVISSVLLLGVVWSWPPADDQGQGQGADVLALPVKLVNGVVVVASLVLVGMGYVGGLGLLESKEYVDKEGVTWYPETNPVASDSDLLFHRGVGPFLAERRAQRNELISRYIACVQKARWDNENVSATCGRTPADLPSTWSPTTAPPPLPTGSVPMAPATRPPGPTATPTPGPTATPGPTLGVNDPRGCPRLDQEDADQAVAARGARQTRVLEGHGMVCAYRLRNGRWEAQSRVALRGDPYAYVALNGVLVAGTGSATGGEIYVSTDDGTTWSKVTIPAALGDDPTGHFLQDARGDSHRIEVQVGYPSWVKAGEGTWIVSTDGGLTWSPM